MLRSSSSPTTSASRSSSATRPSTSSPTGSSPRSSRRKQAAGDEDVLLGGGAEAAQQCLAAGLVDEMQLSVVPILLGSGARLFDNLGGVEAFEQVEAVEAPGVTHLTYRPI